MSQMRQCKQGEDKYITVVVVTTYTVGTDYPSHLLSSTCTVLLVLVARQTSLLIVDTPG